MTAPAPALESAHDLQARLVASETSRSLLAGVASAWLLAAGMWEGQRTAEYAWRAFGWAGVTTLLLLRGCLIAHRSLAGDARALHHHRTRLERNAAALALLWGLSAACMLPGSDFERQALLVVAIGLITMAGAVGRATHVPHITWFVMITSVVFAGGLLAVPGRFHLYIGLGYLLFGMTIALFTRAQDNALGRERELALEIERARQEAEAARGLAERASAAKTRFLATASHDLRQPMHSIGLLVGLMHERSTEPEVRALAEKSQGAIGLMEKLFGSLLDISKLDAGAVQPQWEAVHLPAMFAELEQTWAPQAAARGLRLRLRSCNAVVRSDALLLARILHNLVSNAVNCTVRGGVLVASRRRGDQVLLQVWDTGRGIPPQQHAAIFEEFVRLETPGSPTGGLGLGLAIVQRSAQLLSHEIRLASRVGRGSRFSVCVPAMPEAPSAVAAAAPDLALLRGAFVAVVDDDPTGREATAALLAAHGCLVVQAAGTDVLLAELQRHLRAPDLLLSDLRLQHADGGFETVRRLRAQFDEPIPALLVTADLGPVVEACARALPAQLLHKPAGPELLLRHLVELLRPAEVVTELPRRAASPAEAAPLPP